MKSQLADLRHALPNTVYFTTSSPHRLRVSSLTPTATIAIAVGSEFESAN